MEKHDRIELEFSWGKECKKCQDYNKLLNEYNALKGFVLGYMQSNGIRDTTKYVNNKIIDIKLLRNDLKLIEDQR